MRRLIFNPKICGFEWKDWIPNQNSEFGLSCVQKNKYVSDKVRINNKEVQSGSNRTALYTMPGGIDNGVRYSALYSDSGLDITEIEANKRIIANAKDRVEDMIKEEVDKISTETADKVSQAAKSSNPDSSASE